jgi:uncharacterized repeat protein (TIGR01451 family)
MSDEESKEPRGISRRRAIQAVGAGSLGGLAGCLHDDEPCDLRLSKEHSGPPVTYGSTTDFEISVCNEGDEECTGNVTVTDDLPSGTTFDSVSGSGWTASESGGVVTCEHPNSNGLAGGDCLPTLTLTLDVGQPSEVGPEIANCAAIQQGSVTVDQADRSRGKRDCVKIPIEQIEDECDLGISKGYEGDVVTEGSAATFQIEICNDGEGVCSDPVTVIDSLPNGVTFDSGSGTGWSVSQSGASVVGTHDNSGGLDPGECLPVLELTLNIGSMSETGDAIRNCATLKIDDANAANDVDCVNVSVQPGESAGECDLAITKTLGADAVVEETDAAFEVTICNEGDGICDGPVTVADGLPSGVTFDMGAGTGWSFSESNSIVTATHPNGSGLAPGECLPTLELNVQVGFIEETGDQIRNCVSIEATDANNDNNRDCVSVPVQPTPAKCDLAVTKTHTGGDVVVAGEPTAFDVVVCNEGDGTCDDSVTVTDDLPSGMTFTSASGAGWSISESGGVVTATHGNSNGLIPGDCLPTLTLELDIGSIDETGDQIRNCVSIDGSDLNARNDRDCAVVTVTQPVDGCTGLTIEKIAATQFTYGEQEDYEFTVCNPTNAQCDGEITVMDDLPDGMSYVSHSGSGWNVSTNGGVVTATHPNNGSLTPGSCLPTLTLTVELVPAEQFPGGSDAVQNCAELITSGAVVDEGCVTHVIWNM